MQNNTTFIVDGYGYQSIGDFLVFNKIKTDCTLINRLLGPLESGDYIRLPLKHHDGSYTMYDIIKV